MREGRAPWPTFRSDARAAFAGRLTPLGLVLAKSTHEKSDRLRKPATAVTFAGPGGRVDVVYDPWDVALDVNVNGIGLTHLLARMRPSAARPTPSKEGLAALATLLADLVPELGTLKGRRIAREIAGWQRILGGQDPVAMRTLLRDGTTAFVRAAAARHLASMVPATAIAATSLSRALGDADLSVRLAAADALYHCAGSAPKISARALARALGDANDDLRICALLALRQLGARALATSAVDAVNERARRGPVRERRLATEVIRAMAMKT